MNYKLLLKKLAYLFIVIAIITSTFFSYLTYVQTKQIDIITALLYLTLIAIIIYVLSYSVFQAINYTKEVQRLSKILYEDLDIERYIRETNAAIPKTKVKGFKIGLSINLALGYFAKGDYEKAIDLMRTLDVSHAAKSYKALYYNNLSYFYCEAGNSEEAISTFLKGENFINHYINNHRSRPSLLHTKGVIEYIKGHLSESEELLEKSKHQPTISNDLLASSNVYIAKIYLQTGRTEKAKLLLEYNLSQKLFPNVMAQTQKVLEEMNITGQSK